MRRFFFLKSWLAPVLLLGVALQGSASAADNSAAKALAVTRGDQPDANVVQNRFFLKSNRFEATPILGYVPNNPMVKRYVGGILGAYHFSETFAAEGAFLYSPDRKSADLKGLTHTLVDIAKVDESDDSGSGFQQPLDKMVMGATFAARWSPFYGKINVIGETVLNFDVYGVAGLGMLSMARYYAVYDGTLVEPPYTKLEPQGEANKVVLTPNVGLGLNFFINQTMALKIDARSYLYVANQPQYDSSEPVTEKRLYNNFVASTGISFFVPEMQKRRSNF
jgi:outer membrane beta-barrel protein